MLATFLADYDFDLPLIDAINDPDLDDHRSALAAHGLGTGLDSGYYEAQALADILLALARSENARDRDSHRIQRVRLEEMTNPVKAPYAASLLAEVADLPSAQAASHIVWLTEIMRIRADMYRPIKAAGIVCPRLPGES